MTDTNNTVDGGKMKLDCCRSSECCIDEVGDMVKKLVRVFQLFERDQIKMFGVTTSQCYCLLELLKTEKLTMYELSQKMNLNTSTVTRVIDNLVRDGFIERDRDEKDRRVVVIQLTGKGRDTAVRLNESINRYYKKIIENIPEGNLGTILNSVSILQSAFEAANPNCC